MQISELRERLQGRLASFCWDEWAQLGVQAPVAREDHWAADPEALILLTLEVGREEPRLMDELLDWLAVNERLISVQRLRNLSTGEEDEALIEATIGWLAGRRRRARLTPKAASAEAPLRNEPFYRRLASIMVEPRPSLSRPGIPETAGRAAFALAVAEPGSTYCLRLSVACAPWFRCPCRGNAGDSHR